MLKYLRDLLQLFLKKLFLFFNKLFSLFFSFYFIEIIKFLIIFAIVIFYLTFRAKLSLDLILCIFGVIYK